VAAASIGVLAASDGAPIDEWGILRIRLQPQVWMAIFSVLSNALLAYSFAEGCALRFWRVASAGTTIRMRT
jgi:hypothetical protein